MFLPPVLASVFGIGILPITAKPRFEEISASNGRFTFRLAETQESFSYSVISSTDLQTWEYRTNTLASGSSSGSLEFGATESTRFFKIIEAPARMVFIPA